MTPVNQIITHICRHPPEECIWGGLENKALCAAGLCRSAPGEVGMGGSSPVEESSPLRLWLGDDLLLSSLLTSVMQNKTKVSTLKLSLPGCASQVALLLKKKAKTKNKNTKPTNHLEQSEKALVFLTNGAAQTGQPGGERPGSHQYLSDQRPLTICPGLSTTHQARRSQDIPRCCGNRHEAESER